MIRHVGLCALLAVCIWLPAGFPAGVAADEGFRCGTRLVGVGDHKREVTKKCGDPDSTSQRFEKRKVQHVVRRWVNGIALESREEREIEVTIDEWVYDLGSNKFVRYVSFENNRVISVVAGERGRT
jgi:hypothetical protein